MGLFDILKNVFSNSTNTNKTNYVQATKSNYIPIYHIEDWQPKLKYPEYDKLFSLQKYLESIDLPKTTISKIMKSSNPFGEAKNLFNGLKEKVEWADMCWKETQRTERWIKVLSLWEAPPERIIESTFMYLLLRLGWQCHWDASKQRAFNDTGLNYVLEECKQNEYSKIIKIVDSDIICCFALAHLRSGKPLTEVVNNGFQYLDMNTKHNGSAHGSFYNLFGKQQIKGLIGKIIESAYMNNKFSTKKLFFKEENFEKIDETNYKYDFSQMKKSDTIYIPSKNMYDDITSDILEINALLLEAHQIHKIPKFLISKEDVNFLEGITVPNEHHFCHFTFSPNTPTGKKSKYPFTLWFNCKKNNISIFGRINYLTNNEKGKMSVMISTKDKFYEFKVVRKDNQLKVV